MFKETSLRSSWVVHTTLVSCISINLPIGSPWRWKRASSLSPYQPNYPSPIIRSEELCLSRCCLCHFDCLLSRGSLTYPVGLALRRSWDFNPPKWWKNSISWYTGLSLTAIRGVMLGDELKIFVVVMASLRYAHVIESHSGVQKMQRRNKSFVDGPRQMTCNPKELVAAVAWKLSSDRLFDDGARTHPPPRPTFRQGYERIWSIGFHPSLPLDSLVKRSHLSRRLRLALSSYVCRSLCATSSRTSDAGRYFGHTQHWIVTTPDDLSVDLIVKWFYVDARSSLRTFQLTLIRPSRYK